MFARRIVPTVVAIAVAGGLWWFDLYNATPPPVAPVQSPEFVGGNVAADENSDQPSIDDLLDLAKSSIANLQNELVDYTATFVKQERAENGQMGEEGRIALKVQTVFRSETNDAPKRVYLKFLAPASQKGREVLWGEDLYDGQMAVHETGFLLNLKTIWLHPTGLIAMQGQRHPISEIGLVRLAEKLVERGESLRSQAGVRVRRQSDVNFDGRGATRFEIFRDKPSGDEDDFAKAEVVFDIERNLVLQFQSFGWPRDGEQQLPLLESYSYLDVKTNVGLSDFDFDVTNDEYDFP